MAGFFTANGTPVSGASVPREAAPVELKLDRYRLWSYPARAYDGGRYGWRGPISTTPLSLAAVISGPPPARLIDIACFERKRTLAIRAKRLTTEPRVLWASMFAACRPSSITWTLPVVLVKRYGPPDRPSNPQSISPPSVFTSARSASIAVPMTLPLVVSTWRLPATRVIVTRPVDVRICP